jgi:hypothetical protein
MVPVLDDLSKLICAVYANFKRVPIGVIDPAGLSIAPFRNIRQVSGAPL